MAESVAYHDRSVGLERIERGAAHRRALRTQTVAKPVHHLEPGFGAVAAVLVEAGLNVCLELGNAEGLVVERAFEERKTAFHRVHVPVDETWHNGAAFEGHKPGVVSDIAPGACITAGVNDASSRHGKCLRYGVSCIHRVDHAAGIHRVSSTRCGLSPAGKPEQQQAESKTRAHPLPPPGKITFHVDGPSQASNSCRRAPDKVSATVQAASSAPELGLRPIVNQYRPAARSAQSWIIRTVSNDDRISSYRWQWLSPRAGPSGMPLIQRTMQRSSRR